MSALFFSEPKVALPFKILPQGAIHNKKASQVKQPTFMHPLLA